MTNVLINPKPLVSCPNLHTVVLRLLEDEKRGKVLDAPAGEGALSKELNDIGFEVYACDINPPQFKLTNIDFKKADLNKMLPYESSSLDYVTCVEGIEHIENPWHLIREFSRILREDGKLIITTPNISSLISRALFLARGNFQEFGKSALSSGHITPIFLPELKLILTENKFRIGKITNEKEGIKKRIGERILYYSIYFFYKIFNIFLFLVELTHKIFNHILKRNKKLVGFDNFKYLSYKEVLEGYNLIIKAVKK